MEFFNLKISNKTWAFVCAGLILFVGCFMATLPFIHMFDVVSVFTAFGVIVGCALFIMVIVLALVTATYLTLRDFSKLDMGQYYFGCAVLLGLLGCIWGGGVFIMGFWPYLAMFVGVVLLLVCSAIYLWLHHKRFYQYYDDNALNCFKRSRFIVYLVVTVCLVFWLII